ncbi:hypothetical protein AB0M43_06220 [Longispora sp. NPDC051575]|uniref:hypothetical protein n=1 Tax=Longispora sp. NPDC051575 TaxID=3154943 RepID=UPI0034310FB6
MKPKLSMVVRTLLASVALAGGMTVAVASPAQAAISCSGSICIDVEDWGSWYNAKVWFRHTPGRPTLYGHLDLWGPALNTKYPSSGNTFIDPNEGTAWISNINGTGGQVCGEAWYWNGLDKRYESWGRVCRSV